MFHIAKVTLIFQMVYLSLSKKKKGKKAEKTFSHYLCACTLTTHNVNENSIRN